MGDHELARFLDEENLRDARAAGGGDGPAASGWSLRWCV
jgi:hypothetical protein